MSQKWIYKPEPDEDIVDGLISSIGFGTLESKKKDAVPIGARI